jgi:ATP-binding cassette, subfamily B, bacterial
MKTLLYFVKKQKGLVILSMILATINQVFSMLDPWVGRNILDKYLVKYSEYNQHDFLMGVGTWLLIGVGVAMVSRIAKNLQDYFLNVAIQKSGAEIFMEGVKHTLDLPYAMFEDTRSGETLNILQKVRTDTEKILQLGIGLLYTSVVGVVFVFVVSINIHWFITVMFALSMAIVAVSSSLLSRKVKSIQKNIVIETSQLAGTTTESLRNIELIKSLGLVNQEIKRIGRNTISILGLELRKVKRIRTLEFTQGTIVNFMRNIILLFLSWMVFKARISPGMYIQFLFYTFFIFNPLQQLGAFIQAYREAEVSLGKYDELMTKPVEQDAPNAIELTSLESIEFKNVSFQHNSASRKALENINVSLAKGSTTAFVGPSGSGKSTLVKLLIGLYQPVEGQILYNNINYDQVAKESLRKQLGVVAQESQLFSGTIKDNLHYVAPQATDDELIEVLQKSAAHTLMQRAEKGLNTQIGEGGIKVSGGEKQRISIARALLRKPNLMVFDEATSALDSITEAEITETIKELSQKTNSINVLVAHRLGTIMHADNIYVLEKGQIIEQGTHLELVDKKGLYYAMWRQQIGENRA